MRTTRLITAALAAALTTAAVAGPAAAEPANAHNQPNGRHAGTSHAATLSETTPPVPPTWPANPQPITAPSAVAEAPDAGLDWLSAFIGAAAAGLFAIALAGIADLRRRRITRPRSLTTNWRLVAVVWEDRAEPAPPGRLAKKQERRVYRSPTTRTSISTSTSSRTLSAPISPR